ncbi:hypothetical protein GALMADRAFT_148664 [Galerina marginata CBS 339.88]|uniref:Uncharacterized protein n=1 Tax=Galerina marginata (strain CBS 339.88) TaxID=685588 RepID=A0A067S3U7_GALM3|nr:hypothetical protein GALMADRAFT_148664 [Galerina marginata CBS 339.88]
MSSSTQAESIARSRPPYSVEYLTVYQQLTESIVSGIGLHRLQCRPSVWHDIPSILCTPGLSFRSIPMPHVFFSILRAFTITNNEDSSASKALCPLQQVPRCNPTENSYSRMYSVSPGTFFHLFDDSTPPTMFIREVHGADWQFTSRPAALPRLSPTNTIFPDACLGKDVVSFISIVNM